MGILDERKYFPDCSHNDTPLEVYYNRDKTFGHFDEEGRAYVITDRNTPRPWLQYLCNDKIFSVISNVGRGYIKHVRGIRVTRYWETGGNYIARIPNGERKLYITKGGRKTDFFLDSRDFVCTARQGIAEFRGKIGDLEVTMVMFVPQNEPCECWNVTIKNLGACVADITLNSVQDWGFFDTGLGGTNPKIDVSVENNVAVAISPKLIGYFSQSDATKIEVSEYHDVAPREEDQVTRIDATSVLRVPAKGEATMQVVSAACTEKSEKENVLKYLNRDACDKEILSIKKQWEEINERNKCCLPNKNMEYFLNFWLKNQLYLTYRYNRGGRLMGYRDIMQDSWGYTLVDPEGSKKLFLVALSHMLSDGRCPRQYDAYGDKHDYRDFSDSPVWIPSAITSYIKETGDFEILNKEIPFLNSDEVSTVENHIWRSLEYLYNSRGKNGLIRMRDGDWMDGLEGINKYGEDATSVWVTIATFYAQSIMEKLYERIGDSKKAQIMKDRNKEYKKLVNEVAWDGNWLNYAFFEDGEAIGSAKNLEGKIFLNPQTWGIFSGIIDDEDKIRRMDKAISRYLLTPFGCLCDYPPYVFYGERSGRIQRQRPGTFVNSAVYNHGASFKVYADVKREDYDDALDTFLRCLPNHPDNSDMMRTSEPYAVGNVYYGPNHKRYGMNLFAWFTATAAWLIHGGFEEILGVTAGFRGIELTPHVPVDWNEYSVTKLYRGTEYNIKFQRSADKGIFVDGEKINTNTVLSENKICNVVDGKWRFSAGASPAFYRLPMPYAKNYVLEYTVSYPDTTTYGFRAFMKYDPDDVAKSAYSFNTQIGGKSGIFNGDPLTTTGASYEQTPPTADKEYKIKMVVNGDGNANDFVSVYVDGELYGTKTNMTYPNEAGGIRFLCYPNCKAVIDDVKISVGSEEVTGACSFYGADDTPLAEMASTIKAKMSAIRKSGAAYNDARLMVAVYDSNNYLKNVALSDSKQITMFANAEIEYPLNITTAFFSI